MVGEWGDGEWKVRGKQGDRKGLGKEQRRGRKRWMGERD